MRKKFYKTIVNGYPSPPWAISPTKNQSPLRGGKTKYMNFLLHKGSRNKELGTVKNFQVCPLEFFNRAKNQSKGGGVQNRVKGPVSPTCVCSDFFPIFLIITLSQLLTLSYQIAATVKMCGFLSWISDTNVNRTRTKAFSKYGSGSDQKARIPPAS